VLDFGERLLIPIVDFSQGDDEVIKNLADVAVKMGFGRKRGRKQPWLGSEVSENSRLTRQYWADSCWSNCNATTSWEWSSYPGLICRRMRGRIWA